MSTLEVTVDGWHDGEPIPAKFAFGRIPDSGRFETGGNISPAITWSGTPDGTRSFALICHDPDVPSSGEDVNQEGRSVPASLPRVDFFHWVLVDIPASVSGIEEAAASDSVTPRGKAPGVKTYGRAGINSYTDWFAGDADMEGNYADYDGPCPPWNDSIVHRYLFTVFALDVDQLELQRGFTADDVRAAIKGHVLAQGQYTGTYTMNRNL